MTQPYTSFSIQTHGEMEAALAEIRSPDLDRGKFSAQGNPLYRDGKVFARLHWQHSHYDLVVAQKECEMLADYLNNSKRIPKRRATV